MWYLKHVHPFGICPHEVRSPHYRSNSHLRPLHPGRVEIARLNRALCPLMSGVGSRETGLDSLFASNPVGPGFEPCLGQSARLAGALKPLCLNQIDEICQVSVKRRAQALRLISLAGSRSGLVGLLTVTHPLPSDTPGGRVGLCRGQRPSFRGRCAGGWGDVTHYLAG